MFDFYAMYPTFRRRLGLRVSRVAHPRTREFLLNYDIPNCEVIPKTSGYFSVLYLTSVNSHIKTDKAFKLVQDLNFLKRLGNKGCENSA